MRVGLGKQAFPPIYVLRSATPLILLLPFQITVRPEPSLTVYSPQPQSQVWLWGKQFGQSWRITNDSGASWASLASIINL